MLPIPSNLQKSTDNLTRSLKGLSERNNDLIHEIKSDIMSIKKSPSQNKRNSTSIEILQIKEIYNKKIREDDNPLSFRGSIHLKRRDSSLFIKEIKTPGVNFTEFKMSSGKEAEIIESKFKDLWDKNYKSGEKNYKVTSVECTAAILTQIADNLIQKEIEEQTKENRQLSVVQCVITNSPRARDLIGIVHNALIPYSPIYKRLCHFHHLLVDFSILFNKKTAFTELFYNAVQDLTVLKPVEEDHEGLLSKGINLSHFLLCIDRIIDCTYKPEGEISEVYRGSKLADLNKKMKPFILLAFGDAEKTRKEVFEVLRVRNNSKSMITKLKKDLNMLTHDSIARQIIFCIENLWSEHVDNSTLLQPIDKTPYKDLVDAYVSQNGLPNKILINGEELEKKSSFEIEDFFFRFLSKLYLAFGFDIPDGRGSKPSLMGQIGMFLMCKKHDAGFFSEETLKCFNLLKMGGPLSSDRAFKYLKMGLGDLLTGPLMLDLQNSNEQIIYNFQIDTKKTPNFSVEQIRTYSICSKKDSTKIKANFSISWTVSSPVNQIRDCKLRILKISIFDNAGFETRCNIEHHMANFMQNETLLEFMSKKQIQISQIFNESLAVEAQEIEIVQMPSPSNDRDLILTNPRK